MPKVKIILVKDIYSDYDGGSDGFILGPNVHDWEEISDEDLKFLESNIHYLHKWNSTGYYPKIIKMPQEPVTYFIHSIKEMIHEEEEKKRKIKEANAKKAEENRLKKLAKKAGDEKALAMALLEKYPELKEKE